MALISFARGSEPDGPCSSMEADDPGPACSSARSLADPMPHLLSHPFRVTSYDVDPFGHLRPSSLMAYLQEAGRIHSKALGLSVAELHKQNKTWVMAQLRVQFLSRPPIDTDLIVQTWPSAREEREVIRDFEVATTEGQIVARASASYVIIDLTTRRAIRIGDLVPADYHHARQAFPTPARAIAKLARNDHEITLPVTMRDLDVNLHVNNVIYAQWALEPVPLDLWTTHRLDSLEIAYRSEIRRGDTVSIAIAIDAASSFLTISHQVTVVSSGAEAARIRTTWTPA